MKALERFVDSAAHTVPTTSALTEPGEGRRVRDLQLRESFLRSRFGRPKRCARREIILPFFFRKIEYRDDLEESAFVHLL